MAMCDARYVFILLILVAMVPIMTVVFFVMPQWVKLFFNDEMNFPIAEYLDDALMFGIVPYYIVGDEAFPLQSCLLHHFPDQGIPEDQEMFNYRLSRARRVIKNAFGILAARWRIFLAPIQSSVEKTDLKAHNHLF